MESSKVYVIVFFSIESKSEKKVRFAESSNNQQQITTQQVQPKKQIGLSLIFISKFFFYLLKCVLIYPDYNIFLKSNICF